MKISLTFISLVWASAVWAQAPPIDIELARKDLLAQRHISPDDFIKKLKPQMFNIMYADNLCFVHLPYRDYAGEPFMRPSDVLVYALVDGKWVFEAVTSGWYDFKLVNAANRIFLVDAQFCEPNGLCETYAAVSRYEGKDFLVLREYSGFDKSLHYEWLLQQKKPDAKIAVGDTSTRSVNLSAFMFEAHQTSFTLKRRAEVVSAITKDEVKTKVVKDDFRRVIVNY